MAIQTKMHRAGSTEERQGRRETRKEKKEGQREADKTKITETNWS